jgi:type I restriction enzyme, S subunit
MRSAQLSAVAEINPPGPRSGELLADELLDFVPMAAVSEGGTMEVMERRRFAEVSKGFTAFRRGDLLIAKITPCFENNKIVMADVQSAYAFGSTEFHVVRCSPGVLDPKYLFYFLRQDHIRHLGERRMTGSAGQRRVPKLFIEELVIPLPSLREQQRVAAILDQADALRRKRRTALAMMDKLPQSLFSEMFRIKENASSLTKTDRLGSHLSFITSGGRGWAKYYTPSGRRFLRSLDVQMNSIGEEEVVFVTPPNNAEARRTEVATGDVLLTITGSQIGRVAAVPIELAGSYVSQHVAILRPKPSILPQFLALYLSSKDGGQKQIARVQYGQTKPGLNFDQIRDFKIPVPSVDLQRQFVVRNGEIESLISYQRSHLSQLDALFASLQHRAFNGELASDRATSKLELVG